MTSIEMKKNTQLLKKVVDDAFYKCLAASLLSQSFAEKYVASFFFGDLEFYRNAVPYSYKISFYLSDIPRLESQISDNLPAWEEMELCLYASDDMVTEDDSLDLSVCGVTLCGYNEDDYLDAVEMPEEWFPLLLQEAKRMSAN